jgi:hypothetical protein
MTDAQQLALARTLRRRAYRVYRQAGPRACADFLLRELTRELIIRPAVEQFVRTFVNTQPLEGGKTFGASLCAEPKPEPAGVMRRR